MTPQEKEKLVDDHVAKLMEHFDAVQILVSGVMYNGTESVFRGGGNWFARQGMAQEFITRDHAETNAHKIKQVLPQPPPDDEGEEWKRE